MIHPVNRPPALIGLDLRRLGEALAAASPQSERAAIRDALHMLTQASREAERRQLLQLLAACANTDCAIALHRLLLPANGFELGCAHPNAATAAFAGSWRKGAARVPSFRGATPALALLRATAEAMAELERENSRIAI